MLPERRWPYEPRPAAESVSSPARLWLSLPPHAAASPSAGAAAPPEHRQVEGGQRREDMVGDDWKYGQRQKETEQTKDGIWVNTQWKKHKLDPREENHEAGAPDGRINRRKK